MAVEFRVAADERRYLDVDAASRLEEAPRPSADRRERDAVGAPYLTHPQPHHVDYSLRTRPIAALVLSTDAMTDPHPRPPSS
jgi:hypothetical protein